MPDRQADILACFFFFLLLTAFYWTRFIDLNRIKTGTFFRFALIHLVSCSFSAKCDHCSAVLLTFIRVSMSLAPSPDRRRLWRFRSPISRFTAYRSPLVADAWAVDLCCNFGTQCTWPVGYRVDPPRVLTKVLCGFSDVDYSHCR